MKSPQPKLPECWHCQGSLRDSLSSSSSSSSFFLQSLSVSSTTKVEQMYCHTGAGEFCRAAKQSSSTFFSRLSLLKLIHHDMDPLSKGQGNKAEIKGKVLLSSNLGISKTCCCQTMPALRTIGFFSHKEAISPNKLLVSKVSDACLSDKKFKENEC